VFNKHNGKIMTKIMNKLFVVTVAASASLLTGCVPVGAYQPPQAPQTLDYSREVNANFDATWSAITNVAGATFLTSRILTRVVV
jgi:hypothetical protein